MDALLTIGEFSKMTYLSVKALRHYHDVGLLEPVDIDSASGYRRYTTAQVSTAQAIRRFRDLDMPLEQVRAVLDAPDVTSRNAAILTHLQHMQEQLERTQTTVASLQALLEDVHRTSRVTYRSIEPASALAITEMVAFDDSGDWCGTAFDELHGHLADAGIAAVGPDGALYFSDFFELGLGRVTAFVPTAGDPAPSGRAERHDVPAADVAVLVHEGLFADLDRTYGALGTHVALQRIGAEGPIREHYVVAGADVTAADHRTEVCWPIEVQRQRGANPR